MQRDFIQAAFDAGCDYLIIDAQDLARLLIAYEKICPQDGTTFDEIGACKKGHLLDEGLTLEVEVKEDIRYTISRQKDTSHYGAKRYSAIILTDRHYSKDILRTLIQEVTEKIKNSSYYRSERIKKHWGKSPAHVVWLFIAYDLEDVNDANWVCRTCWIDPSLSSNARPRGLNGNEQLGDIQIFWNDNYKLYKEFFQTLSGTKEDVLEAISLVLSEMVRLAQKAIDYFEKYKHRIICENDFIAEMQQMEPRVTELSQRAGIIPSPPEDCKDYYQSCHNVFAAIDDMFLYYSERGLKTWAKPNRDYLMQAAIRRFHRYSEKLEFEEGKIH